MRLLFLKDVGGVAQRGTIKEVADGYAMNYLIPHGLAVQATPEKIKEHEHKQAQETQVREAEAFALTKKVQALEGARIEMTARATEKGGLFKSITAQDVARAILEQKSIQIASELLNLPKPIKQIGEYPLVIQVQKVKATVTVAIAAA
jgi:large subunit ribosomal protein L9